MEAGGGGARDGRRPNRRAALAAAAVSALALCLVAASLASSVASARRPVLAQVSVRKARANRRRVRRSEHSQNMGLFNLLGWGPCLELRACARPPPELLCLFSVSLNHGARRVLQKGKEDLSMFRDSSVSFYDPGDTAADSVRSARHPPRSRAAPARGGMPGNDARGPCAGHFAARGARG
jgi:hypothetical protein